jgi:intracellular sulfur oxidation DsrE/DsrF family protein
MDKLKVLFHINENEKWKVVLGNIANLLNDAGEEKVDIVVLANGFSVYGYADPDKIAPMEQLSAQGVKFVACQSSLKNMCQEGVACLKEELLPSFIGIVPLGITEIIRRQQDGFAYVKP